MREGSAGYVTTIHLFSDNTINQNKLGWERENRLPAPREAIPLARPASSSSFVAACACRVHLEHKRTQARRIYPGIRMQDNARMCAHPCVPTIIGVCAGHELGCCAELVFGLSRVGRLMLYTCSVNPVQPLAANPLIPRTLSSRSRISLTVFARCF